jgi:hypothetical protein
MSRCITLSVALSLLVCASNALADHHETSTFEEFQEMGELAVGRWVGDIKFIADWPGEDLGKGDRVVGYVRYEWLVDKKAFRSIGSVGNNSNTGLFVWDPVAKQIKLLNVSTRGGMLEAVLWKKAENVYGWRMTGGGLADGRAHSGTGEWVFSEDGRTMTLQGQTMLAGEKNDPLKDVYKKLSP